MKLLLLLVSFAQCYVQADITRLVWESCGTGQETIQIKSAEAYPMPVTIPGKITASGSAVISEDVVGPIKAKVVVEKQIDGNWIPFPICVKQIGSCSYRDVCAIIKELVPGECPELVKKQGLPCHCPFKKGNYTFQETTFGLPAVKVPPELAVFANGAYRAKVSAHQNGTLIFCNTFTVSVKL